MTSSTTSLPVQHRDHIPMLTPCFTKRQVGRPTRSRRSKGRHRTTNDAKLPNNAPSSLSTNKQPNNHEAPTVLDTLVHSPSTSKSSVHPEDTKPACNCSEKTASSYWLHMDVERDRIGRCVPTIQEILTSLFEASDNKLAMKLYGNRNALMKERLRQRAANKWVIHPCSDFR